MVIRQKLKRINRLLLVALLVFAVSLPLLNTQKAGAYGLLPSRSITMSSSADGDLTAGQNVTYHVRFDIATTGNVGSIVVEFCSNSPIIGDTNVNCDAIESTYALDVGTPTVSGQSNAIGTDFDGTVDDCDLTAFTTANDLTDHTLALTATSPQALTAGATCFFDITTMTNPNEPNRSFFARIYTYADIDDDADGCSAVDDNAECYTLADPKVFIDAGGIALSTAAQITITSKVPEKLTFCVFTVDGSVANTCGTGSGSTAPSGTAVTLGDNNGVLSDQEEFVNKDAKYTIATNALFGVAIRVKGGTLKTNLACPETPGQSCSIDAIGGADPGVEAASAEGTEQFGFCTYQSVGAGMTPAIPYSDAECNTTVDNAGDIANGTPDDAAVPGTAFGFFNDATTGTTSTYGDVFANKISGTFSTGVIAFLGNITATTEPGIYVTTLTFIATGTY